jgi:hypothetical protein
VCIHCAHNKPTDLIEPDGHGAQFEKANPGSIQARRKWFVDNDIEMPPERPEDLAPEDDTD